MTARKTSRKKTTRKKAATRKTASRKKTARKKTARKSPTRKKAARKKTARKKASTRRTTSRKKTARKSIAAKASASRTPASALARLEAELPKNLRDYGKQVRRQLNLIERQIEQAQKQTPRRWARLIRDASHQLGRLEALGERNFRKLTTPYRKEAARLLRQLERAVAPPAAPRKKAAARARR